MRLVGSIFLLIQLVFIQTTFASDLLLPKQGDHTLGNPSAKLTIIEYSTLSCVHCGEFQKKIFPELKKRYIDSGKVLYIHRDFPTNKVAFAGSKLLNCVEKERYNTFLKVLFDKQESWVFSADYELMLENIARLGGISSEKFKSCQNDKAFEEKVTADTMQVSRELGVNSTPTFFLNGEKITGALPIEEFSRKIDKLLK